MGFMGDFFNTGLLAAFFFLETTAFLESAPTFFFFSAIHPPTKGIFPLSACYDLAICKSVSPILSCVCP